MELTIHYVNHGLCISLIHEYGNVMLWDCGRSSSFEPSAYLRKNNVSKIDYFFITNYDQDHISELPKILRAFRIEHLVRNESIYAHQLCDLKNQGGSLSLAMRSMLDMIRKSTCCPPVPPPYFPGVTFGTYCNLYGTIYNNTNDISLVTFLTCNGTTFLIPGDIEKKGWDGLLAQPGFIQALSNVDVFVASHHGRESGYHASVMNAARPKCVVISDSSVTYGTQDTASKYRQYCSGIRFNCEDRYVLSTRNDGSLVWRF